MSAKHKFPKGHKFGGYRANAGRKPNWFKEKCSKILIKKSLVEFVGRVAAGEETEQRVTIVRDGSEAHTEVVEVKASIHDRLYAFEMLANWGVGKPQQSMELSGSMTLSGFVSALRGERKRRGLD
jgi:hypothetical protein